MSWVVVPALCSSFATSRAARAAPTRVPELSEIRYQDPVGKREIWAGFDFSGSVLPRRLAPFNFRVWTVQPQVSWAISLAPFVALGGRHGLSWYDATSDESSVRSRVHKHHLELSFQPLRWRHGGLADRLTLFYASHDIAEVVVEGTDFHLGGLNDYIMGLGYGIDHPVARRWSVAWQLQLRHAWVFQNTQRQARASLRVLVEPRARHQLYTEAVGYVVHRDDDQFGIGGLELWSVVGQFKLGYRWMSVHRLGFDVHGRFNTAFMVGEAPVYELRAESIEAVYGELSVGFRGAW